MEQITPSSCVPEEWLELYPFHDPKKDIERFTLSERRRRLRWQSRRALLELDIVLERYWRSVADDNELPDAYCAILERLLAKEDHDLWNLFTGHSKVDDPHIQDVLERLRLGTYSKCNTND